jgi:predicted GNAT superfamily acetyltransferase
VVEIGALTGIEQFREAVNLQRMIWGWEDLDLLPVRFFVVARSVGGQVLGAFTGGTLCGFLLAIPGITNSGEIYLHSHMTGLLPEHRNTGAGLALKLAQKADALSRGIEWSFDPLDLKNAYFNIEKLGATVERYEPNLYGFTTSALQAGLPTDRCIAVWNLAETRAHRDPVERVSVPAAMAEIKRENAQQALAIQQDVAEQFTRHLNAGLTVTGFKRGERAGTYLFSRAS